eukprot:scaffold63505_cov28-Tisochrysis_lutea.AAC.5
MADGVYLPLPSDLVLILPSPSHPVCVVRRRRSPLPLPAGALCAVCYVQAMSVCMCLRGHCHWLLASVVSEEKKKENTELLSCHSRQAELYRKLQVAIDEAIAIAECGSYARAWGSMHHAL